ncbi:MAG: DUF192 domain-containing protein, partial [Alphaproteobacteria bacterium]
PPADANDSELVITTAAGVSHTFTVELAVDDKQRETGLMFRHSLAPNTGMLFYFGTVMPVSMWMKNTFIPLDMLFIAPSGRIVGIAERTIPHSLDVVSVPEPVISVLEVNGGTTARLGVKPGDRVRHRFFPQDAP